MMPTSSAFFPPQKSGIKLLFHTTYTVTWPQGPIDSPLSSFLILKSRFIKQFSTGSLHRILLA